MKLGGPLFISIIPSHEEFTAVRVVRFTLMTTIWYLWREHNNRLHSDEIKTMDQLTKDVLANEYNNFNLGIKI